MDEILEQVWSEVKQIVRDDSKDNDTKMGELKRIVESNNEKMLQVIAKQKTEYEKELKRLDNELYFSFIVSKSARISQRIGNILKVLPVDEKSSDRLIVKAVNDYRKCTDSVFCKENISLLSYGENQLKSSSGKLNIRLCRSLLLLSAYEGLKSGRLNLLSSYQHQSVENYFIEKDKNWEENKVQMVQENGLGHLLNIKRLTGKLQQSILSQLKETNENIRSKSNPYFQPNTFGKGILKTPGKYEQKENTVASLFEKYKYISLRDILLDVNHHIDFIGEMRHKIRLKTLEKKDIDTCIAAFMSYGCNIGYSKMSKISNGINSSSLKSMIEWYFNQESLDSINEKIIQMTRSLPVSKLFQHQDFLQTSSDGQKFDISVQSLNANYSYKYFGKGKGVTAYNFVDENTSTFYTTVISASEREATYLLDGLLHNDIYWEDERQWLHHTDTHGQTEVMFTVCYLLGINLSPRIKGIKNKYIYSFEKPSTYKDLDYAITPMATVDFSIVEEQSDNILRLMLSLRLKKTSASLIFNRLSSYSRQHPLYKALKELGRIYRSIYILKYYDNLELRQITEGQLNKVERSHQFAKAIFYDNNQKICHELKEDQNIAMSCKTIIGSITNLVKSLYFVNLICRSAGA